MKHIIRDEELMDYLDGNLSANETADLKKRLVDNGEKSLLYHLRLAQKAMIEALDTEEEDSRDSISSQAVVAREIPINFNRNGKKGSTILVLDPMRLAAAKTDGYLCDIECEEYILLSMGYEVTKKSLLDEAYLNKWMKEKGMPIYHIGRLLEKNRLAVARRYNASLDDLANLLEQGNKVIAVVNAQKLSKEVNTNYLTPTPNHAVVVLEVSKKNGTIRLFDPQTGNDNDTFTLAEFNEAWTDSQHFLVVANEQDCFVYDPQPIEVDDTELSPELLELSEAIAENAHEIWAMKRKSEGWSWGPERNDRLLQTPDMTPYSNLSEEEKDYDRQMAMQTLKLVQKIGYSIVKSPVG